MTLEDVRDAVDARQRYLAMQGLATAVAIAAMLSGGEGAQALIAMIDEDDEPPTLAEKYGTQVATDVAALNEEHRQWMKHQTEKTAGADTTAASPTISPNTNGD